MCIHKHNQQLNHNHAHNCNHNHNNGNEDQVQGPRFNGLLFIKSLLPFNRVMSFGEKKKPFAWQFCVSLLSLLFTQLININSNH